MPDGERVELAEHASGSSTVVLMGVKSVISMLLCQQRGEGAAGQNPGTGESERFLFRRLSTLDIQYSPAVSVRVCDGQRVTRRE